MVVGIDKFREHFAGHENQYALIGGAACDLIFADAGLAFRATKDLDIVLCVEVVDAAFATAFSEFIDAGGYEARQKSDGHREFFRFIKPADKSYPYMIELFARQPGDLVLPESTGISKVPVDEDVISLSAILLDADYFAALQSAKVVVDDVSLLSEQLLIAFKAKAHLDLVERKAKGDAINDKDIKKHRNDVFRLAQLLPAETRVALSDSIRNDLRNFVASVRDDESLDPRSFNVPLTRSEAIALLETVYAL